MCNPGKTILTCIVLFAASARGTPWFTACRTGPNWHVAWCLSILVVFFTNRFSLVSALKWRYSRPRATRYATGRRVVRVGHGTSHVKQCELYVMYCRNKSKKKKWNILHKRIGAKLLPFHCDFFLFFFCGIANNHREPVAFSRVLWCEEGMEKLFAKSTYSVYTPSRNRSTNNITRFLYRFSYFTNLSHILSTFLIGTLSYTINRQLNGYRQSTFKRLSPVDG